VAISVVSLLSCFCDDSPPVGTIPPVSNPSQGGDRIVKGTLASISANHGHNLIVSSRCASGVQKNYALAGDGHSHNVTVSAANFSNLANGHQVLVTSTSGDGHTHSVTISCT